MFGVRYLLTTEGHQRGPEGRTGGSCRDASGRHNLQGQKRKRRKRLADCPDVVCWQGRRSRHRLNSEGGDVNTNQKLSIFTESIQREHNVLLKECQANKLTTEN